MAPHLGTGLMRSARRCTTVISFSCKRRALQTESCELIFCEIDSDPLCPRTPSRHDLEDCRDYLHRIDIAELRQDDSVYKGILVIKRRSGKDTTVAGRMVLTNFQTNEKSSISRQIECELTSHVLPVPGERSLC